MEWLSCCFSGSVSAQTITATVGSEATLRCRYDAKYHGRLHACWGRSDLPFMGGCRSEVIETDGTSVTRRLSDKYQLLGDQGRGDVSLTIRSLQEKDSGKYSCRVHISGWFNDQKSYVTLKVVPGEGVFLRGLLSFYTFIFAVFPMTNTRGQRNGNRATLMKPLVYL